MRGSNRRPARIHARLRARGPRAGLSLVGGLSLVAVISVLVAVSLPRLRSFASNENEADARSIVRLLSGEIEAEIAPPVVRALAARDEVRRALSDTDYLADGQLLRRHGYLFAVIRVEVPDGPPGEEPGGLLGGSRTVRAAGHAPRLALLAWPWERGRTGSAAFLATPDKRVFRHANDMGHWNGPGDASRGPLTSWTGWQRLP